MNSGNSVSTQSVGAAAGRGTVFVVDDDPSVLNSLARLLRAAGHTVATFRSAPEFLAHHQAEQRGCVVTDLQMPGTSGLELQSALAASGNPLPVVFLTAHGDIPTSVRAMRGGAEDFLMKPVRKEELLAAVGRAMARDAAGSLAGRHHRELQQRFEQLTRREREVLHHIVRGQLNKQIAAVLGTTERTIKAHRASIMEKLQAQSAAELGRLAQAAGLGQS